MPTGNQYLVYQGEEIKNQWQRSLASEAFNWILTAVPRLQTFLCRPAAYEQYLKKNIKMQSKENATWSSWYSLRHWILNCSWNDMPAITLISSQAEVEHATGRLWQMDLSDDSVWDGQTRAAPLDTHHFPLCLLDHSNVHSSNGDEQAWTRNLISCLCSSFYQTACFPNPL